MIDRVRPIDLKSGKMVKRRVYDVGKPIRWPPALETEDEFAVGP